MSCQLGALRLEVTSWQCARISLLTLKRALRKACILIGISLSMSYSEKERFHNMCQLQRYKPSPRRIWGLYNRTIRVSKTNCKSSDWTISVRFQVTTLHHIFTVREILEIYFFWHLPKKIFKCQKDKHYRMSKKSGRPFKWTSFSKIKRCKLMFAISLIIFQSGLQIRKTSENKVFTRLNSCFFYFLRIQWQLFMGNNRFMYLKLQKIFFHLNSNGIDAENSGCF